MSIKDLETNHTNIWKVKKLRSVYTRKTVYIALDILNWTR